MLDTVSLEDSLWNLAIAPMCAPPVLVRSVQQPARNAKEASVEVPSLDLQIAACLGMRDIACNERTLASDV